jgi:hypothetical protein
MFRPLTVDSAVAGGMVYLMSEIEKMDPKVREPLTSVTFMRDMPIKSGGGWVNFSTNFFVDYGVSSPNLYGLVGTGTTDVPIVQGNVTKDVYRVFNWSNIMKISFIDMNLAQQAGRSLEDIYNTGIKLNWNKTMDLVTYQHLYPGVYGLVNDPNISHQAASLSAANQMTQWIQGQKTADEIIYDIETAQVTTWGNSQYDVTGMATHILIPPIQYTYIASQKVSAAGNVSILSYILENNISKTQGRDLKIYPSRWCISAGLSGVDRMVGYVADENKIYLDVTVPITRVMTMPSVTDGGTYNTLFAGQISSVKKLYTSTIIYIDGV